MGELVVRRRPADPCLREISIIVGRFAILVLAGAFCFASAAPLKESSARDGKVSECRVAPDRERVAAAAIRPLLVRTLGQRPHLSAAAFRLPTPRWTDRQAARERAAAILRPYPVGGRGVSRVDRDQAVSAIAARCVEPRRLRACCPSWVTAPGNPPPTLPATAPPATCRTRRSRTAANDWAPPAPCPDPSA